MSKATHTPGPWAAFYKYKYNEWHVSVPVSNSDMRLSIFPDGIPGDTPEEAEGNARLIAAAPDLLAVCENIKKYLDFVSSGQPTHGTLERELYYRLQAAIAAAKGE